MTPHLFSAVESHLGKTTLSDWPVLNYLVSFERPKARIDNVENVNIYRLNELNFLSNVEMYRKTHMPCACTCMNSCSGYHVRHTCRSYTIIARQCNGLFGAASGVHDEDANLSRAVAPFQTQVWFDATCRDTKASVRGGFVATEIKWNWVAI